MQYQKYLWKTDTVVGIGCSIIKNNQVNKNINEIFEIKKRGVEKKLPWLISSVKMLENYVDINDNIVKIIEKEWPGDTTIVLHLKNDLMDKYRNLALDDGTIAFRIPDDENLRKIIENNNAPIACTSANISGNNFVNKIVDVDSEILNSVDFVYEHIIKKNKHKKPSKILRLEDNQTIILRN